MLYVLLWCFLCPQMASQNKLLCMNFLLKSKNGWIDALTLDLLRNEISVSVLAHWCKWLFSIKQRDGYIYCHGRRRENGLFSPQVSLNHLLLCKTQQVEQMRDRHTLTSSSPTGAAPYQGCRESDFVFLHISSARTYVTQVSGALQSFLHLLSNPQFLHLFAFTFPLLSEQNGRQAISVSHC